MRVLRMSMWLAGESEPMVSMVVREQDLADTLESTRERMLDEPEFPEGTPPEVKNARPFIGIDLFVTSNGEIEDAVQAAMKRLDLEREANQAIAYHYGTLAVLPKLHDDGTWVAPDPAPLDGREVEFVLNQIARHANYKSQRVVLSSEDGEMLTLHRGVVKHEG